MRKCGWTFFPLSRSARLSSKVPALERAGAEGPQRPRLRGESALLPPNTRLAGQGWARGSGIGAAPTAVCCDISRVDRASSQGTGLVFRLPPRTLAQSPSFIMWRTAFPQTVTEYFRRHVSITVMLLKTFFFFSLPFCKITVFILIQKLFLSELFSARVALAGDTKEKAETRDTIPPV